MPESPKEEAASEKAQELPSGNHGSDVSHYVSIPEYTKEYYFTLNIQVKFYTCANDWYQALIYIPARTAHVKGPGYEAMM